MDKKKAEEYRALARRVREQAAQTTDPQVKQTLLEIAGRYDWMAEWLARDGDEDESSNSD